MCLCFFFSSRRRHTRWPRDWSSDVCSSDLAAKFTDRGLIVVRAEADRCGVRVAISDTGCGIREDDLPRLFVPFGQLEDAHTKTHAGTGLGLAITRSLASLLRGRVVVQSRRGEGSTFTLELPHAAVPEEAT